MLEGAKLEGAKLETKVDPKIYIWPVQSFGEKERTLD
jgi:hypothetical protein